jgi:DNA polymerase-3 subunit epsilon
MIGLFQKGPREEKAAWGGVDTRQSILECRYVVMDTELTGLDLRKDSIVSLGAVAMEGSRIIVGEQFAEIVNPETTFSSESVIIHGITPAEASTRPVIEAVIDDFLRFCEGAVVVGHFVALDLGFLNKELKRIAGRRFDQPVVDTLKIHEWLQEQSGEFSRHYSGAAQDKDLFSLAKKHQIPVSSAHDAQMDAFITAQLFQRFLPVLPKFGVTTVKDLLRIGRP